MRKIINIKKNLTIALALVCVSVFLILIGFGISRYSHATFKTSDTHNFIDAVVGARYQLSVNYYVDGTLLEKPVNDGTQIFRYQTCDSNYAGVWDNDSWSFDESKSLENNVTCNLYFTQKTHCEIYGFDALSDCVVVVGGNNATTVTAAQSYITSRTTAAATKPNFATVATTDLGMYSMADDFGTSYYYRGATTNNNVIFGGFQWKIIRVEGNGSVKLIYNGVCANSKTCTINGVSSATGINGGESTTWSPVDPPGMSNTFFGYMYNVKSTTLANEILNVKDSNLKLKLETWYANNILGKPFEEEIVDTIFCNDRQIQSGNGYNYASTIYKPWNRNVTSKAPKIKCDCTLDSKRQKTYCYSTDENTGGTGYSNGVINYPVGTITLDEVAIAGGVMELENKSYYLYSGTQFWTLSPAQLTSTTPKQPMTFLVRNNGSVYNGYIYDSGSSGSASAVRPVISLSSTTKFIRGTGTSTDPYVVTE